MTSNFINVEKTKINEDLYNFVSNEIIPGTSIDKDIFWKGFVSSSNELAKKNKSLLKKRDDLQKSVDTWHVDNKDNFSFES